jgi:hypothetical protein
MLWRGTVIMGASEGDREAGASPLAVLGVAATKVEALRGISQEVILGTAQGHPEATHGLCRGVPLCQIHRGPALARPMSFRRTINAVKLLLSVFTNILLGFERL